MGSLVADDPPPRTSDPVWRAEFAAQCQGDAMAKTRRWAERRVQRLDHLGIDLEGEDAESLVQAALCAILAGTEPWDPSRYPLSGYVYQVVRSRTSKMASRGRPWTMPLDDMDEQAVTETLERDGASSVALPGDQLDAARALAETGALVLELRRLAGDDHDLQRVMSAMADGATTAADIVHATGLSRERYRATKGRLDRLVKRIPPELRAAAGYAPATAAPDARAAALRSRCHRPGVGPRTHGAAGRRSRSHRPPPAAWSEPFGTNIAHDDRD
jgi:hypothetical protein